ncbi:hypothetical protein LTR35_012642 [Friedmanniomyces endolithicus]|uniref:EKC/KEOPS complex subunit BUD32 n=1 Tax=Friedmanniomyces endolithicus TaxID=329885 RepID=A0AAN6JEP2_9PEZI|nr:hypothetical protein LTR35_012642 [Friedmanniomyces endolithicus]KAK0283834.1 hypothetical protein LTS00_011496 [Friedmanniomyces endolithicus]KAK0327406.1 hypothetical protein LTR82_000920 [Friedmanniomyces endolithicus]KAK0990436.1 hypothetical protein LTR54_012190 [Friedmanniomyces endolithicus]
MSSNTLQPVSPPTSTGVPHLRKCYVDANNQLWEVFWTGSSSYPEFAELELHRVLLSDEMSATWSRSKPLDFGASAVIRILAEDAFPVVKLAPNAEARQLLQHEFAVLLELSGQPGIVKVDPEPLTDKEGICGYRMEYLTKIDFMNLGPLSSEVQRVTHALHRRGYCHGDLSPSNVMVDNDGKVVLIDLSFAGVIGEEVPSYIPRWAHSSAVFSEAVDESKLEEYFRGM